MEENYKIKKSLKKLIESGFSFNIRKTGAGDCANIIIATRIYHDNKDITVIAPSPKSINPKIDFKYQNSKKGYSLNNFTTYERLGFIDLELIGSSKYWIFAKYLKSKYPKEWLMSSLLENIRKKLDKEGYLFSITGRLYRIK